MTASTGVPRAIVWPWARCVDAKTSCSPSAAQTPTSTASWPIATCRKPGSSPARNRSSTFCSKRRIRSMSRRSSCRRSSGSASLRSSSFAIRAKSMLPTMRVAEQWRQIEDALGGEWAQARLRLTLTDVDEALTRRAAGLLGPLTPARRGLELRFVAGRRGEVPSPQAVARALTRLDDDAIPGRLELVGSERTAAGAARSVADPVELWERELTALPPDWSDVHGEVRLDSTDYLEPGALALAPVNPSRVAGGRCFPLPRPGPLRCS